jgi:hypothetical protein
MERHDDDDRDGEVKKGIDEDRGQTQEPFTRRQGARRRPWAGVVRRVPPRLYFRGP